MVTDYVEILQRTIELNKAVTLAGYAMFVNGILLFFRTYRLIKFTTLKYIPSRTKVKLGDLLRKVISIYNSSGFKIRTALV